MISEQNLVVFCSVPKSNSDFQQTSANRDGDRVRPVIRSQLVDHVLDMEVDGRLRNPESIGNLLVAMAVADQPQHVHLTSGEVFLAKMLGQPAAPPGPNMPSASAH